MCNLKVTSSCEQSKCGKHIQWGEKKSLKIKIVRTLFLTQAKPSHCLAHNASVYITLNLDYHDCTRASQTGIQPAGEAEDEADLRGKKWQFKI